MTHSAHTLCIKYHFIEVVAAMTTIRQLFESEFSALSLLSVDLMKKDHFDPPLKDDPVTVKLCLLFLLSVSRIAPLKILLKLDD